jgi:hypothetical protein
VEYLKQLQSIFDNYTTSYTAVSCWKRGFSAERPKLLHNNNAPPAEHRAVAMVKIIDKIRLYDQPDRPKEPFFSFEYFPPKTDAGVENL